jgi:hypothetical protein
VYVKTHNWFLYTFRENLPIREKQSIGPAVEERDKKENMVISYALILRDKNRLRRCKKT